VLSLGGQGWINGRCGIGQEPELVMDNMTKLPCRIHHRSALPSDLSIGMVIIWLFSGSLARPCDFDTIQLAELNPIGPK